MGAFYLLREPSLDSADRLLSHVRGHFSARGFALERAIATPDWRLLVYRKTIAPAANLLWRDDRTFAFAVGTMLYRGRAGEAALAAPLDAGSADWQPGDFAGQYCLGVCRGGRLELHLDGMGLYKVYRDMPGRVLSSSFLAVLESIPEPRANPQAVYEYVFQEAPFGTDTVVAGIAQLDCRAVVTIDTCLTTRRVASAIPARTTLRSRSERLERALAALRRYFATVVEVFGDRIVTALSGGYDSRLMLALLRDAGARPRVHVYGRADSADVRIAKAIAAGEGLALEHIDKGAARPPRPDAFAAQLTRNLLGFDGYPADGIFDDGGDLATRQARCAHGEVMLNGGGGGGVPKFLLSAGSRALGARVPVVVLQSLRPQDVHPAVCRGALSRRAGREGGGGARPSRHRPLAPRRRAALPRLPLPLLDGAQQQRQLPVRSHAHAVRGPGDRGRGPRAAAFRQEQRAFRSGPHQHAQPGARGLSFGVWPRLRGPAAAPAGCAGHPVNASPPFLRRYAYRLKAPRGSVPEVLGPDYLAVALDPRFPWMSAFFRVSAMRDPQAFNRMCTLEVLFERYRPQRPSADAIA